MTHFDIFILAIALSIDACVVSFSNGLVFSLNKRKNSLILASAVGFFQFLMPLIGWVLGQSVHKYVEPVEHWLVFVIFILLGTKFIMDAFKAEEGKKEITCYFCFSYILLIAVATSIDALAAGASLYFAGVKILIPAIIIGIVTFINSLIGFWGGFLFQRFSSKNLEIFGGIILILLAFKTLLESLTP